jgi:cold shock protein
MEGTIKWFNTRKGFGFVKGEDGEDYFVHYSALEANVFLRENDKVSFDPAQTDKGKQAQNVKLLQKGSERDQEEISEESDDFAEEAPAEEAEEKTEETEEEAPAEEVEEETEEAEEETKEE